MKREDTPQQKIAARTVFILTREEVVEALVAYVRYRGEAVLGRKTFIFYPDYDKRGSKEIVKLQIEHD